MITKRWHVRWLLQGDNAEPAMVIERKAVPGPTPVNTSYSSLCDQILNAQIVAVKGEKIKGAYAQRFSSAALRTGDTHSLWDNQTGSSSQRTGRVVSTSISIDVMKMMQDAKDLPRAELSGVLMPTGYVPRR